MRVPAKMLKSTFLYFALPEENVEEFSASEKFIRWAFDKLYRLILASFFSYLVFYFLFSPVWMHGYVWSLNLPIDLDMADKSAGLIVDHQTKIMPYAERYALCSTQVAALYVVLWRVGFADRPQRVSRLLSLATVFAFVSLFIRTQQAKHRLFPAIHEAAYTFVLIFVVGVTSCVQKKRDGAFEPEAKDVAKEETMEETKEKEEDTKDDAKTSDAEYEVVEEEKSEETQE